VRIERIAEEMEISRRSAHRWVASASRVMPIRLESGTIIYEEEGDTMIDETEREILDALSAVWGAIEWDRYSPAMFKKIYGFLADRVRASANQAASYARFAELLSQRMQAPGANVPAGVADEAEFLRRCREETTYLIAAFRQRLSDMKEAWPDEKHAR
jgi:hypothetical protein